MRKSEILSIVNQLPDDKEIDLIVFDGNDNWDCSGVHVDNMKGYDCAELVFTLGDGYIVTTDEDRLAEIKAEKEEDEHLNSMEYVCESMINGQRTQAVRIFKRNKFTFREFTPIALQFGIEQSDLDGFVDAVMNYDN